MSLPYKRGFAKGASFNARVASDSAWTNQELKAAPGAGLAIYVTDLVVNIGGTSRAASLLNGSGGSVLWKMTPAADSSVVVTFSTPIQLTANTALCLTTAGASVGAFVAVHGFVAEA